MNVLALYTLFHTLNEIYYVRKSTTTPFLLCPFLIQYYVYKNLVNYHINFITQICRFVVKFHVAQCNTLTYS